MMHRETPEGTSRTAAPPSPAASGPVDGSTQPIAAQQAIEADRPRDRPRERGETAHAGRQGDYIVDDNGCWIWQRKRDRGGYGRCQRRGRGGGWQAAHRWYYEELVGPVPPGTQIDHLCRNRACVNPAHLEPVSHAENARRGDKTRLTPDEADQIRASQLTNRETAARFGISVWHVEKIKAGTRWAA